jgi:hypothetical protein
MGHKNAAANFPRPPGNSSHGDQERRYNTAGYYEPNRRLGRSHDERPVEFDDQDMYDDFYSGKQENYEGAGYYGSNYGSINELNRGRDVERNAGYRDNYDRLTSGQWPEIQEAA